jgi:glycosyltransferase involved in cell wall biosynthesis
MKITLIGPVTPYRGGIAHFTTILTQKLIAAGHELQVISFKKQYPAWLYPGESDKDHSPGRETVDAQFLLKPLDPLSWRKTLIATREFSPERVIIPWWVTFWGPAFHYLIKHLKRQGIPIAILIHNTLPHEPRPWDRFLARRVLKEADRYIVMTEKEKGRLLRLIPGANNIHVSPLPIDDSFPRTGLSKFAVREKLEVPMEEKVILFFGIIRPYKGLNMLIDAFGIVSRQIPAAHLWVVGEFWEDKNRYLSQVKNLGLEDRVHFTDRYIPDDEIGMYFEAADLFVAPYINGTQSAAIRTALGFGLPVVATDVIRDELLLSLHNRCFIVKAGNADALQRGMIEGLQRPDQDRGRIEALIEKTWIKMIVSIIDKSQPLIKEKAS